MNAVRRWRQPPEQPVDQVAKIERYAALKAAAGIQIDFGGDVDMADIVVCCGLSFEQAKAAVELLFKDQKVQVGKVNVVNVKGKEKRHGRFVGRRKNTKKAYVSLVGDGDINFVEGVA